MFTYIFKQKCNINDLMEINVPKNKQGFYSEHEHYRDIVMIRAWSKKDALYKVSKYTTVSPGYSIERRRSYLYFLIYNLSAKICKLPPLSYCEWLSDY